MQTVLAGLVAVKRNPLALVPMLAEALLAALMMVVGLIPAEGNSVIAGAVFPLDIYFDLKQSLASASGWPLFALLMAVALAIRSAVLTATLWIAAGRPGEPRRLYWQVLRLAAWSALALLPAAAFLFTGTAIRYAPFILIGAVLGLVPAVGFLRKILVLDAGAGRPRGAGLPELGGWLGYAYLIAAFGAAMTVLSTRLGSPASALLVVAIAPVHCLFLLGWREHLERETFPGGGSLALILSAVAIVGLGGAALYDRHIRVSEPVGRVDQEGSLLLLSGVDTTSESGALVELDPRDVGFRRDAAQRLSYRGLDEDYGILDTRGDLDVIAQKVAEQVEDSSAPRFLLGHSQAALILDRVLAEDASLVDAAAVLSGPPRAAPHLAIPKPDRSGIGKPAGDVARAISWLVGMGIEHPFDVDAPGAPLKQRAVQASATERRLAVWPLVDSVWLDQDWRRPGEINVVAFTDHVGVVNNGHALSQVETFFAGEPVSGDESSFAGFLAAVLRYTFEPWRPRL
ncbi:MAG TPA: hypothetical protein VHJ82_08360 [Actinomycetota bacterium]|nr:hypothetical protein [Actinomycetota bacterium]